MTNMFFEVWLKIEAVWFISLPVAVVESGILPQLCSKSQIQTLPVWNVNLTSEQFTDMEMGTRHISFEPVIGIVTGAIRKISAGPHRGEMTTIYLLRLINTADSAIAPSWDFWLQTNPFQVVLCFGTKTCWTLKKLPEVINYLAPLVTEELDAALPAWFQGRRWIKAEPEDKYILDISHNITVQQRRRLLGAQDCCR